MNINSIKTNDVKNPNNGAQQIAFRNSQTANSNVNQKTDDNIQFRNNFEGGKANIVKTKEAKTLVGKLIKGFRDLTKLDNPNLVYFNNDRDWGNSLSYLSYLA